MKIGIATNYSYPLSGGCETVTRQIAEGLKQHDFIIYSSNVKKDFTFNNVEYKNYGKNHIEFIQKTKNDKLEHLLIYSDHFKHFVGLLGCGETLPYTKSISLVGMNAIMADKALFERFKNKKDQFSVIDHSALLKCIDICKNNNINVNIIPNGIDLDEFKLPNKNKFKEKYNISKDEKVVLCVSNFFHGKGQEIMPAVAKYINNKNVNYVFISSTVEFPMALRLEQRLKYAMKDIFDTVGSKSYFYKDLTRSDIIDSFSCADVFAFPSLKESFGIVPLESNAVGVPFVAFDVGEMPMLRGGEIIYCQEDINGYKKPLIKEFAGKIKDLLDSDDKNNKLGLNGLYQIQNDYSLEKILKQYNDIFIRSN